MRRLVITADDFGAHVAVNDAVEIAHRTGILSAASLMVAGAAVEDAVQRAKTMPALGVGLHLVLVDGRPVLPADQVPALVGPDGRFHDNMLRTSLAITFSPAAHAQMRAEVSAQFAAFAATGLPLDHVNAHKHFHMHPVILTTILDVGKAYGCRAIRCPREGKGLLAWWAGVLGRRLARAGFVTNDQVVGLAYSGAFTAQRMREALGNLPAGLTEIYTHPATCDTWPGSAPGYAYAAELAALTDPHAKTLLVASGVATGSFAEAG